MDLQAFSFRDLSNKENDQKYLWELFEEELSMKSALFSLILNYNIFRNKLSLCNKIEIYQYKINLFKSKHFLRKFILKITKRIKIKELKTKTSLFIMNSLTSFVINRFKDNYKKKPVHSKFNYERFYYSKLKKIMFNLLKTNINLNKNERLVSLKYSEYSYLYLIKQLYKICYMKKYVPYMIYSFITKQAFKLLINRSKVKLQLIAEEKLIRKISLKRKKELFGYFIFSIKKSIYINKTSTNIRSNKRLRKFEMFTKLIKEQKNLVNNKIKFYKKLFILKFNLFKQRRLNFIVKLNRFDNLMNNTLRTNKIKQLYSNLVINMINTKKLESLFFKKVFFNKVCFLIQKLFVVKNQINESKQEMRGKILTKKFSKFKNKIYLSINSKSQNNLSSSVYNSNLVNKSIKIIVFYLKNKKEENKKYLKAKVHRSKKIVLTCLKSFALNRINNIQFRKKKEAIIKERRQLILSNFVPIVYQQSLEHIKIKENVMKKIFLNKTNKINQLVIKFIKQLQKLIIVSKNSSRKKTLVTLNTNHINLTNNKVNDINNSKDKKDISLLERNFEDLKALRVKQRTKPKKLNEIINI